MIQVLVAAVVERKGKILLVQEGGEDCYGKWNLPTGHLEPGEDIFSGAIREIKEETGYDAKITGIVRIYEYIKEGKNKFRFTFSAETLGEPGEHEKGIISVKWFGKEEILKMDDSSFRNAKMKIMLVDYFAGKRYPKDVVKFLG